MELNLLENGIDFILKGIDELYELEESYTNFPCFDPCEITIKDYKYPILHLFSGFLLLLKERIARHLPELIFEGDIQTVKQQIKNGKKPNTINYHKALTRLEVGPRVTFSEQDKITINNIRKFRNKFEHYKISENRLQLEKEILNFIKIIDNFLVKELEIEIESKAIDSDHLKGKIIRIQSIFNRITKAYKDKWLQDIQSKLADFKNRRDTILEELEPSCYDIMSGADIIPDYISCPNCNEESLIPCGDYKGICINENCGEYYSLDTCNRCGETMIGYFWQEKWCDNCEEEFRELCERDD